MKILPIENIIYKSHLSKDEVYYRLINIIRTEKTYIGGWTNNTFNIKRNINYRNSFLPQIKGEICKESEETLIIVKMRLHLAVIIFISFWLIGVSLGCIFALITIIFSKFDIFLLIPFLMLLFGVILTVGSFKSESNKSKKDLLQIFEAEILK